MSEFIDGRAIALGIEQEAVEELARLRADGIEPHLVSLQVGHDPASEVYLRRQKRAFDRISLPYERETLPDDVDEATLEARIRELDADPRVTGIMLQMPLPDHLDGRRMRRRIEPEKDVEGVHPENLGYLLSGRTTLVPCTSAAAVRCIDETGAELRGKEVVVVGHSETVGKPIGLLLLERGATVTVCHKDTRDLAAHTRRAEVLVVAVGKAGLITPDMVRPEAVVIDIGINEVVRPDGSKGVVGDVAPEVSEVASYLTPVPGGVGPITVALLLMNTLRAARRALHP